MQICGAHKSVVFMRTCAFHVCAMCRYVCVKCTLTKCTENTTMFRFLVRSKAMERYANNRFIVLSRHHPDHASTRRAWKMAFCHSTNDLFLFKIREVEAGMIVMYSRVSRKGDNIPRYFGESFLSFFLFPSPVFFCIGLSIGLAAFL